MQSFRISNIRFSTSERIDLVKAWFGLSLAFSLLFSRSFDTSFIIVFVIIMLTAGIGFLLHEIAHKVSAIYYGHKAEFVADDKMLLAAIVMALFLPIVFAAPGAVYIRGLVTNKQNGIISVVGPWTNLVLALLFLPLAILGSGIVQMIGAFGFSINSWLALFNMFPIPPLDGSKVWAWNKIVYAITIITAGLFTFVAFF
ncbi:MAG: hypothetical protein ACMXYL_05350 [Candidatus Woesearchaeota archaeon]